MAAAFSRYGRVNESGFALTLFRTDPLMPIDALARAYSSSLGSTRSGSSLHDHNDRPAYPRSIVPSRLSQ